MLNLKSLGELKEKILAHKSEWKGVKDKNKYQAKYDCDKQQIVERIDFILESQGKIDGCYEDIAEALKRLGGMGFVFLEEAKPKPKEEPPKSGEMKPDVTASDKNDTNTDTKKDGKERKSAVL